MKKNISKSNIMLHGMLIVPIVIVIIFNYVPMFGGILVAIKNYKPGLGIIESQFVGLDNFKKIFLTANAMRALENTLVIAVWKIIFSLVIPIVFALLLNEIKIKWFKKAAQTITYLPFFISWVILASIFINILSPAGGLVNRLLESIGIDNIYFLGNNNYFRKTMVVTDVWKNCGYNAIIYLAALTNIDPTLYEAASIDGAGRWKQTLHITMPGIGAFIALMAILSIGNVLNAGFDQIFNMYSVSVYKSGDIIDTLVYRLGMQQQQYSFSTAVGFFKSIVSLILIVVSNFLAKKFAGYRVF